MDSGTAVGPTGSLSSFHQFSRNKRNKRPDQVSQGEIGNEVRRCDWCCPVGGWWSHDFKPQATMQPLGTLEPSPPINSGEHFGDGAARVFESLVTSKQCRDWGPRFEIQRCMCDGGICSRNSKLAGEIIRIYRKHCDCDLRRQLREVDARWSGPESDHHNNLHRNNTRGPNPPLPQQALTGLTPLSRDAQGQAHHSHHTPIDHRPPTTVDDAVRAPTAAVFGLPASNRCYAPPHLSVLHQARNFVSSKLDQEQGLPSWLADEPGPGARSTTGIPVSDGRTEHGDGSCGEQFIPVPEFVPFHKPTIEMGREISSIQPRSMPCHSP